MVLSLKTFEATGQVVHPDVALTPPLVFSSVWHLALTSYPYGKGSQEYPAIFESRDGVTWTPQVGAASPLFTERDTPGVLSDPDWVYVPESKELWLYYRTVTSANTIFLSRSNNGSRWTRPAVVAQVPNHELVSPSVVHAARRSWSMWSVNGGPIGCNGPSTTVERRSSTDGQRWSAPRTVDLVQPGYYVWHIDVTWIPSLRQYWAVYPVKTPGNCVTPAVFLATSDDGDTWTTYPSPVLVHGADPALQDVIYRSSVAYEPRSDAVRLWFSGATARAGRYVWSAATQTRRRESLLAQIRQRPAAQLRVNAALPPPEP